MANTLLSVFRSPTALSSLSRLNSAAVSSIYAQKARNLYAKATLGLDGFNQQREKVKGHMLNISEKFKEKMTEYTTDESKNMIFTEDLKNMIHLCDNDQDVELVVNMIKRYNKQNKSLRFGNYIFGPVVMRMFYIHNKPELAFECFKSEEMSGFFDQYMSYQILLDLLYENQQYNEIFEAVELIKDKMLDGSKYPKNVVVLALAACYKMNTKESLDYALKLWAELQETGHRPMRRAVTFCAALALNQGKPEVALEVLTSSRNQNYTTVRNLKVVALTALGRIEDVIPILKLVVNEDSPQQSHTFNKDVLETVRKFVTASNNPEITLEFDRLEQIFQRQGNISEVTLDEQLCTEIQKPPSMNNRDFQSRQGQFETRRPFNRNFPNRSDNWRGGPPRAGLNELV